jgi:CubicO group peptidase (beta-lactamase class C family)
MSHPARPRFARRPVLVAAAAATPSLALAGRATEAAPPAARTQEGEAERYARVDAYLRRALETLRTPGLSVVVVEGGVLAVSQGYGWADAGAGVPMTDATPVALGSTTKGLTALAVLQLVEQGRVDLDAPVTRYLPAFRVADARGGAITLRHLLSHQAGLPGGAVLDGAQDAAALARRVAALRDVALIAAPGEGYEYANDGYSVAGLVVQEVAGRPYERVVEERVFAPLGMARSTFDPVRAAAEGMAQGYAKRRGEVGPTPTAPSRGLAPAGMAISTARDAGRYLLALLNGGALGDARVLSAAGTGALWTPHAPVGDGVAYGLGWQLREAEGRRLVEHGGNVPWGGSMFLLLPDRGVAVGVLANLAGPEKEAVAEDVLRLVLGGEPPARPAPPDWRGTAFVPDPAVLDSYAGEYPAPEGPVRVVRQGDRLLGEGGGLELEFVALSATEFVLLTDLSALDEAPAAFRPRPDGAVDLYLGGQLLGTKR